MNAAQRLKAGQLPIATLFLLWFGLGSGQIFAGTFLNGCYDLPGVIAPKIEPQKALYVLIDQTMEITQPMKKTIVDLVSEWGTNGERVLISRFSANIKGNFTELVFDEVGNIPPSEAYLFHLRRKHKKSILACIKERKTQFHDALVNTLTNTLKLADDKLPKTNLIHSLNDFAEQLIADRRIKDKTVLLVSDGLENSDLFSFHKRGNIKSISHQNMLNKVRRKKLIPNWYNAKIYLMGLGYISDEKAYIRPRLMKPLKRFWTKYFLEGNGVIRVNSIGTPMLLTRSILH